MFLRKLRGLLFALVCSCGSLAASATDGAAPAAAPLSSEQIVSAMERQSQSQTAELKHYRAVRHYQVDYKGFGTDLGAKMEVEVNFDAPAAKSFRILSQSGSKMLIEKVLKRLLETEKAAAGERGATALTPANYRFAAAGSEIVAGRPAYILNVEPLTGNKLLYRGRIWVDAADFALVKIDAEPAKNPSFWISHTRISHSYVKTGGFWLPEENRSESKVRVGGTAVLTIDYGTYQIGTEQASQKEN